MDALGSAQTGNILTRAQVSAEDTRLRQLERQSAPKTKEDLAHTAREFEGVFLNILMQAMRQTVPQNDLLGGGGATRIYRQMYDSEMARTVAASGSGLGIARLIEQQFADRVGDEAGHPPPAVELGTALPPTAHAAARYRQSAPGVGTITPVSMLPMMELDPLPVAPPVPVFVEPQETVPQPTEPPVAPTAVPGRLGMIDTDRRLSASPLASAEADTIRRHGANINRAADRVALDPRLVLAVVMEESGGNPKAESRAGARGLMQLMPGTARDLGVADSFDAASNLAGGARYLAQMMARYGGKLDLALAAYNAGPGNVDRAGGQIPNFPETRVYVQRVLHRYNRLCGGTNLDKVR